MILILHHSRKKSRAHTVVGGVRVIVRGGRQGMIAMIAMMNMMIEANNFLDWQLKSRILELI